VTVTRLSLDGHILIIATDPDAPPHRARPSAGARTPKEISMDMEVTKLGDNVTCVRLRGRMDAPGIDAIDTRFTAATAAVGRDAVVDLSGVSFLASMGIRLLISSARALNVKHAKLVLFGAQDLVQNVLDQAAIDQIIPIVASEVLALERLKA
jgi:anti-sigma B factor antagonist